MAGKKDPKPSPLQRKYKSKDSESLIRSTMGAAIIFEANYSIKPSSLEAGISCNLSSVPEYLSRGEKRKEAQEMFAE